MAMCGGMKQVEQATPEVQQLIETNHPFSENSENKVFYSNSTGIKQCTSATNATSQLVKVKVEEKAGKKLEVYEAKLFATQLVNGINYFVKVHIGNGEYIHVRAHKAFNQEKTVSFHSIQDKKQEADELAYF
ncbi:cystatin-B-like isoform X1 [Saccoglossus kowalevskii]